LPGRGARPSLSVRVRGGRVGAAGVWRDPRLAWGQEPRRMGVGVREPWCRGCRSRGLGGDAAPDAGGIHPAREQGHAPPTGLLGRGGPPAGLWTRPATLADAAAIAAIYNEGIADRIATFETVPRSSEEIAAQLADKGDRFPTVVAERDGQVVAWAGAGAYRS